MHSSRVLTVAFILCAVTLLVAVHHGEHKVNAHSGDNIYQTGNLTLVSVNSAGEQANSNSWVPTISGDGRIVSFLSTASNLDSFVHRGVDELFAHDMVTHQTVLAGKLPGTEQPVGEISCPPALSIDGRYLAFCSLFDQIVPGDDNRRSDIFRLDRITGEMIGISLNPSGIPGNNSSYQPSISADGRYIAFESSASDLVNGDGNEKYDIFIRDVETGKTELISSSIFGTSGNGDSRYPSISADGRFVAFYSGSSDLVAGDTNNQIDIFLHDSLSGEMSLISIATNGSQTNADSKYPSISPDGNWIAYTSWATNLVTEDQDSYSDIYLYDRHSGETILVSNVVGNKPVGSSIIPSVSNNGRYVTFTSTAAFSPLDDNTYEDVYLYDRLNQKTVLISQALDGSAGNGASHLGAISTDGCMITFDSHASDLTVNDANGYRDIFVFSSGENCINHQGISYLPQIYNNLSNLPAGEIAFVSDRDGNEEIYKMNPDGSGLTRLTYNEAIDRHPVWSPDGKTIAFTSQRDGASAIYLMSTDGSNQRRLTWGWDPYWSPDGQIIAFHTHNDQYIGTNIATIKPDGSNEQVVFEAHVFAEHYHITSWLPDNQHLFGTLFYSKNNFDPPINCLFDLKNKTRQCPTGSWLDQVNSIDFSRDGIKAVYTGNGYLNYSNADGTESYYLMWSACNPNNPITCDQVTLAPDKVNLAFTSTPNGNADIFGYHIFTGYCPAGNPNCDAFENLTNHPAKDYSPSWSPTSSISPPPSLSTCSLAGITQPTIVTDFQNGLAEFGARPVYTNTSQTGQVVFTYPGVKFTSNTYNQASLAFQSWSGGDTLAVRLRTSDIYQVGLVSDQSVLQEGSWANAITSGGWMLGLHVDHYGSPNGNILYLNSAGTFTIGERFNLPDDEEVVVVFRLSEHRFKIYASDGALLVDILLPAEWFNHGTPAERWWVLGDAWSDSLTKVGLQVFDLCYSESP